MAYSEERRAKVEGHPEAGTRGSKSNDCDASLRKDNLPQAEEVKVVDMQANLRKAVECAQQQNGGNQIGLTLEKENSIADARAKNGVGIPLKRD